MKVKLRYIMIIAVMFSCSVYAQGGNYALHFNGFDEHVGILDNPIFDVSQITIEMWMYWENTTDPDDVDFLIGKATEEMEIHTGGGSGNHGLRFIPTDNVYLDSDPDVFLSNTWYHIAFVYDPSGPTYKFYLNGVEKNLTNRGANPTTTPMTPSDAPLLIGARESGAQTFEGKLDEVRIWNYVRSAAQINANMYSGFSGGEGGLIAYYKMSNGSGFDLTDNTGHGNDGFLVSDAMWVSVDAVLPVELISFEAEINAGIVNLNWSTATEVNNYGFEIQRTVLSPNNSTSEWKRIGFIQGNGNSNRLKSYTFTDDNPPAGKVQYRLKQIDSDGKYKLYEAISVEIDAPQKYTLMQNSPNPFNPSTSIKFQIPEKTVVSIKIFDIMGREVAELLNDEKTAGSHIVYWNGRDDNGQMVSSGIYLYKLSAGNYTETRKMNLLK